MTHPDQPTPAVGDRYTHRTDPDRTVTVTRVWEAADGPAVTFEWRDGQPGKCAGSVPLGVFHLAYRPAALAPVTDLPPVPCLDWGLDRAHDAHTWTDPAGETARCPGWMPNDGTRPEPAVPAGGSDQRRQQYADAARTVRLRLGPNALAMAQRGEPIILSGSEADAVADAVTPVAAAETAQLRQQLADAQQRLHLIDGMRQANLDAAAAAIQRAEWAEAALDRVRALTTEHPVTIDTALIHAALDRSQP